MSAEGSLLAAIRGMTKSDLILTCQMLPGNVIKGQHEDEYGKPNGWCWCCWWSYRTHKAERAFNL